jgi:hypothetical protein
MMRLTLRTLLAWLDDTLPPTQVREIGKQVEESPFAQELVERIRRVTRQRRLTIPGSTKPEATDPNVVAGYLDNDLEPEQVAEHEKKCLSSDVNLAEAASVHQILSMLGQKVQVPPESKARMYQLVRGREAISPSRPNGGRESMTKPDTKPSLPWEAPEPTRRHWLKRFGPAAACLALITILSWSAYQSLSPSSKNSTTTFIQPGPRSLVQSDSQARAQGEAAQAPASTGETSQPTTPALHSGPARSGIQSQGSPADAADSNRPKLPLTETQNPSSTREKKPGPEGTTTATKAGKDEATELNESPLVRQLPAGSVGLVEKAAGVLLRYNSDKSEWERMTDGTALFTSDLLLSLAPFRARITLGKVPITLVGETQVRLLSKVAGEDPALELDNGKVILDNSAPPGVFKVDFAGRTLVIERRSRASLALERVNPWQYGQPALQAPSLAIHASEGTASLTLERTTEMLAGPGTIQAESVGQFQPRPDGSLPTWITQAEPAPEELKLAEQFLKKFSAGRPVLADIVAATEDDSQELKRVSISAVKALGDLSLLTPILDRANDPIARRATLTALRDYLAQGPQAARRLREQLQQDFGETTSQIVEKLLIGYSSDESAEHETFKHLVDLISPRTDSIGVRELALDNLKRLTGRNDLEYDPDHPEGKGLNTWKSLLNRGALRPNSKRKAAHETESEK